MAAGIQPIPRPKAPTTGIVRGPVKLPVARPVSNSPEKPSTVQPKPPRSPKPSNGGNGSGTASNKGNGGNKGNKGSGATNWLKPLTQKQITNEATSIVNKEYKPTYTDLNNQASQAKALDAKRAADTTYYENWLASQGAALQTANSTMMGSLENANAALAAGANGALQTNAGTVSGAVAAEANPASATNANAALTASLTGEGLQKIATDTQASNTSGAIGASGLGDSIANAYSGMSAVRGQQITALDNTLQQLATTRAKAHQAQIGDLAKEINTLQTNEVNKAQAQQSYREAAAAFGLNQANTQSEINARQSAAQTARINARTSRMNAITSLSRAQQEAMYQNHEYQLNLAKLGFQKATTLYEQKHHLGQFKPASSSSSSSGPSNALSQAGSNAMYKDLEDTRGQIMALVQQHGLTPQQAYNAIRTGGEYAVTTTKQLANGKTENVTTYKTAKQQGNTALLNAAFALYQNRALTPKELKALNAEGLYGVRKRYSIKTPPPNTVRPPAQRLH